MLTKTGMMFDRDRIGVNDLVQFKMNLPSLFKGKFIWRHGMINEVHDSYVTIRITQTEKDLNNYVCNVEEADDKLRMVERAVKVF